MKKKILLLIMTMAMACFVLSGCGEDQDDISEETVTEEVTEELSFEDNISVVSDGEAVTDDAVFGENTYVFSAEDDIDEIQKQVDEIYEQQEENQFGDERYAILFKEGTYDESLTVNVGYYTQVLGLGVSPDDTVINKLWVDADWMNHNATCNFWRSAENFAVNEYCMWANSQAVSLRRMHFHDSIVLSDGEGWSSGGFFADSVVDGSVYSGSQQQYLFRNNEWGYFENGVWNMVFVGINPNRITTGSWPSMPYTKVETTSTVQEKAYLTYYDDNGYGVIVPEMRDESTGTSWSSGTTGTFYSLNTFYIAYPGEDDAQSINEALSEGKNILFTPGIYEISETIKVENPDTIIYGMGLATLVSANGNIVMEVSDVDGVKVSGILFEAGDEESETLLLVGDDENSTLSHETNPIVFSDIYFRVGGGSYAGKVQSCVVINADNVIGDNFWVWRADHTNNVGWDVNTAPNGIIINGDNVIMYGLFVEHFQEYQTIWNGNGGKLYFYQSEQPYDAPDQDSYMSHDGTVEGYASIKVADDVTSFESYGVGIYCYNRDADINTYTAVEVPDTEGVVLHNTITVELNGQGGITHVINDSGDEVTSSGDTARVLEYEDGEQ